MRVLCEAVPDDATVEKPSSVPRDPQISVSTRMRQGVLQIDTLRRPPQDSFGTEGLHLPL